MGRNPGLIPNFTQSLSELLKMSGLSTGNTFFVDSGSTYADDNGPGDRSDKPMATLDAAVGKCTANNGDKIIVMPGHAETYTAAGDLNIDVAGIEIVGLGVGDTRPTFTLGTATTCDIDVDAANVKISGLRFVSAIDSLAVVLDVNAANCTVEGCDFIGASTLEIVCGIDLATTVDGLTVRDCYFFQPTDPDDTDGNASTGCIYLVDSENVTIEGCRFIGFWETAFIHNKTTLAGELWIKDCYGLQALSGALVMILVDNATGGMINSHFCVPAAADVAEASFMTLAATTTFGMHHCTFMNDGAGGNRAVEIAAAT